MLLCDVVVVRQGHLARVGVLVPASTDLNPIILEADAVLGLDDLSDILARTEDCRIDSWLRVRIMTQS